MGEGVNLSGQSVLVTGATGSFGSAMLRRLVESDVRRIIAYSRDEFKQHQLQQEITDPRLRWFLGDVRDKDRLRLALRDVQVVIHAAALKHVTALQANPLEAVKTNVLGTMNVLEASLDRDVEKVLSLSTDKAVEPVNLYGATKATMERLVLDANTYCGPKCSVVRYGNVAGSRGSVIPLWRWQRARGQALTLTDSAATRFWITLDKAVAFVWDKLHAMQGGEIFVPAMPSVQMLEVARSVAKLTEAPITITGMKPGEKIHETVVGAHESVPGLPSPYASNSNPAWLTGEDLDKALALV